MENIYKIFFEKFKYNLNFWEILVRKLRHALGGSGGGFKNLRQSKYNFFFCLKFMTG